MAPKIGPHFCYHETMSSRRGWGEDGVFFEHDAPCRDSDRHRHCEGRWRGVVSLGFGPDGKRIRRKVSGKTKAVVQDRLKALHGDLDSGVRQPELHRPPRRRGLAGRRTRRPLRQDDRWVFGDKDTGAYLPKPSWTDIVRHTLVKSGASPDDPALAGYWA